MKVGTCGFCEKHSEYYKNFDVIEIQNTFYDFVKEEWLKKIREESPDNFEITIKGIQIITHKSNSPTYRRFKSNYGNPENYGFFKHTEEVYKAMELMIKYLDILKSNIIVLQAPPNFHESEENLKNLKEFFSEFSNKDIKIGLELRGKWDVNTIKKIVEKYNIIHVTDPFKSNSVSESMRYYRLHGIKSYNYKYTDQELLFLKKLVNKNDYVLFNNIYMCEDAKRFKNLIQNI